MRARFKPRRVRRAIAAAAGCHATFDRFVIRARLGTPGYDVRLGLRRKTGFRVFRLSAPTRIVVDVAH